MSGGPLSIAYLLDSTELFGGVKVALLQAEALARRGHRVTVVSPDAPPEWFPLMRARFERSAFSDSPALAAAQVRVATFWETVRPALAGARGPVFHLCQGYEGEITYYRDRWRAIEEVYRLPTHKLAISPTLAKRLASLGLGPVADVGQAFDQDGFFPAPARPVSDPPEILVVGPLEIDFKGVAIALEGLACGVPALLSNVPGQREIGGDAAWYFADGDPESLARALPELLTEDARARAREAGPAAARRYDTGNVARRLEEEFRAATAMLAATGTP